jgi:hypothetical protein
MDVIVSYPGVWSFALHGLCGTCTLGGTDDHCNDGRDNRTSGRSRNPSAACSVRTRSRGSRQRPVGLRQAAWAASSRQS